jgi:hypothetical protein
MSKHPFKAPKMDFYKTLLPEAVHHSSRFCVYCHWVIEEQRDLKHEKCPRCQEVLPLVANLNSPSEAKWLRCKKCYSFARTDFKFCELCGLDLASTIREARQKQAAYLQNEERKTAERTIIREKEATLAEEMRLFQEMKAKWEREKQEFEEQRQQEEEDHLLGEAGMGATSHTEADEVELLKDKMDTEEGDPA